MRRQGRHEQLDGPGGVHLLADDPLGLAQGPQAQRQVGVGPGHHLVDQAGAEHEHVAGDFRPFGRFFHRGDEGLGPEHGQQWLGVRDVALRLAEVTCVRGKSNRHCRGIDAGEGERRKCRCMMTD